MRRRGRPRWLAKKCSLELGVADLRGDTPQQKKKTLVSKARYAADDKRLLRYLQSLALKGISIYPKVKGEADVHLLILPFATLISHDVPQLTFVGERLRIEN